MKLNIPLTAKAYGSDDVVLMLNITKDDLFRTEEALALRRFARVRVGVSGKVNSFGVGNPEATSVARGSNVTVFVGDTGLEPVTSAV
jgi:hypothetical protein